MTYSSVVHCPDCGAITRRERQDDGDEVLVCTDDECPQVIVAVISRSVVRDPESWQAVAEAGRRAK